MATPSVLEGRVALVIGGDHGLGSGITEALVAAGAQAVVGEANEPEPESVDALVAEVVANHGRLDIAVNQAGPADDPGGAAAVITRNLLVPLAVAEAANRVMQHQDTGGSIVNLAAMDGLRPSPGRAAYGAAAAGLINLTQSLAAEWGPKVRVNCVSPGSLATTPVGRAVTPDDVAASVLYLASPAAAYVSGVNLVVHGGGEPPAFLAAIRG